MLIGIILGLILGGVKRALSIFEPVVDFTRSIPPILAFPLFLVAFNYAKGAYVWTVVFGCLPIVILTVSKGVSLIPLQSINILNF